MGLLRFYTGIVYRNLLPKSVIQWGNRLRRKVATRQSQAKKKKIIARHGIFGPDELFTNLLNWGIQRDGVLLVQSAFGEVCNFNGTAEDLLGVLETIVGDRGTLVMPAHTNYRRCLPHLFDINKTPAHTGILCELFRRNPQVLRSLHPRHSVCAKGPLAEELLREHNCAPLSFGIQSPYAKLINHKAQILGLGLEPGYTSFLHVIEDINPDNYPRKTYLDSMDEYTVTDYQGNTKKVLLPKRNSRLLSTINLPRFVRHLSKDALTAHSLYGISCFTANASSLFHELQILTDRQILVYD